MAILCGRSETLSVGCPVLHEENTTNKSQHENTEFYDSLRGKVAGKRRENDSTTFLSRNFTCNSGDMGGLSARKITSDMAHDIAQELWFVRMTNYFVAHLKKKIARATEA